MQGYNSIDQILHQLSQVIAKVNKAYLPHQPDDSHTNLYFDELGQRITGRWFLGQQGNYLLVFDVRAWEYYLLNDSFSVLHRVSQNDKSPLETESEIIHILQILGFAVDQLQEPLHFEIPSYSFINEKLTTPNQQFLESWIGIRNQANYANQILLGYLQKVAEIRIWPHHFDTGVYVEANPYVGIGFGLAMADAMVDTPYFYLAGYELKDKSWDWDKVNQLDAGKWMISDHWKGAVLQVTTAEIEKNQLTSFIKSTLQWYLGA